MNSINSCSTLAHDRSIDSIRITAESLGSREFREQYNIKYAYVAGAMYKGIASQELVVAMGKAGLIGFLGSGGMKLDEVENAIHYIQDQLEDTQAYGINLLCHPDQPELERRFVDMFLEYGVRNIEAAAFMSMTPALVKYRLKGLARATNGQVQVKNRVLAKCSRPEVASLFMNPAPSNIVEKLVAEGEVTDAEAELGLGVPMSNDICIEADSGGHTDQGVAYALVPAIMALRQRIMEKHNYQSSIHVGTAGGIGTPEAAAAAFTLGADFILTGSINQCTVEAGTSDLVKDMLGDMSVQDTTYAPAGDMFELGAKVQVLKKAVFFPARANKLYDLYSSHNSLDEIDEGIKDQIQKKYFRASFEQVWKETKDYLAESNPDKLSGIQKSPKLKMAAIFKWYFINSTRLAMTGAEGRKVDYQVHCGPALGAFNQWVKGSKLETWRNRRVADIGCKIMQGAAGTLAARYDRLRNATSDTGRRKIRIERESE